MTPRALSIRTEGPPPEDWASLARSHFDAITPQALAFREELGLPTDRPIIMTGHQPGFWHAGILVKYLAADALASAVEGAACAVVVDTVAVDPLVLSAPDLGDPRGRRRLLSLSSDAALPAACTTPPIREIPKASPRWVPQLEPHRERFERVRAALAACAEQPSLAMQAACANDRLLRRWQRTALFRSSTIMGTTLGRELIERMRDDPESLVTKYNAAVRAHDAGVRELYHDAIDEHHELPLWLIEPTGERRRVFAEMLPHIDHSHISSSALSMTAILRLAGADLFIHGTGGHAYDEITDRWIAEWLGQPLAPRVAITADAYIHDPEAPDAPVVELRKALADAKWALHHAKFDPEMLGDPEAAARKDELLDEIERHESGDIESRKTYLEMHSLLARARSANCETLKGIAAQVDRAQEDLLRGEATQSRSWPAVLLEPETLDALKRGTIERLGLVEPSKAAR